jgi:hypothetical protein
MFKKLLVKLLQNYQNSLFDVNIYRELIILVKNSIFEMHLTQS